jgi:hypothetical protein
VDISGQQGPPKLLLCKATVVSAQEEKWDKNVVVNVKPQCQRIVIEHVSKTSLCCYFQAFCGFIVEIDQSGRPWAANLIVWKGRNV